MANISPSRDVIEWIYEAVHPLLPRIAHVLIGVMPTWSKHSDLRAIQETHASMQRCIALQSRFSIQFSSSVQKPRSQTEEMLISTDHRLNDLPEDFTQPRRVDAELHVEIESM